MIGKFSGPRRTVDFPGERGPMRVRYRQQNRLPRNLALTGASKKTEARAIHSAQTY